jgi:LPS-assembly protein
MHRSIALLAIAAGFALLPSYAAAQSTPTVFANCSKYSVRSDGTLPGEQIPERPGATRYVFRGRVTIVCDGTSLLADEIAYEDDTGRVLATGQVLFQQPGLWLYASRADFNSKTKNGVFSEASGTAQFGEQPVERSIFGTMEPDVFFYGEEIEKTGPDTYKITRGFFTTCTQPTPRWQMSGSSGTITLDKRAVLRNVVLRVKDVPLLYIPVIYYPIGEDDRSTGFLLPTYGTSGVRGTSISNAFFWAISRNQDATFYHDWYAKAGQGLGAEYRYVASPGSQGEVMFTMLDERERLSADGVSVERQAHRSYELRGQANQALPKGFRLIGRTNYYTDITTKQLYQQDVYDFSDRTRYIGATLTGGLGRYRFLANYEQRDLYYNPTTASRDGRTPIVNVSIGEKLIGRSRVYFGAGGEVGYLLRQVNINDPTTDQSLWRFDGGPTVRAPLSSLSFLTVTTSASWRFTRWLESKDPITGIQRAVPLNRQLIDLQAQIVGPVLARVFQPKNNGYAERFKHLIAPSVTIRWTSPFDKFNQVVLNDYSTDAQVGGKTSIYYRLSNSLHARRRQPGAPAGGPAAPGVTREVLTVEIGQTFYSDALAANYDPQYQTSLSVPQTSASKFSPVQVTAATRPTDQVSAQFSMEIDSQYRQIRNVGAGSTIYTSHAQVTAGWSKRLVIPGLPGFSDPTFASHYLNATVNLRTRDNRVGGTYAFNRDILRQSWLQQRFSTYFNSQCCGVSLDYQSIGTTLASYPSDRRFGVSFTLAGIGSFANPFGSFGGR